MQSIFLDESGSLGFNPGGTAFFVLAFIAPASGRALNKCVKNVNAHLIRNGWNRSVEIKASNVWHAPKNSEIPESFRYKKDPSVPMEYILNSIAKEDGYIDYVVIKLAGVPPGLRQIPNCILYSHFAWLLLKQPLCHFPVVALFVDRKNREYHSALKFDGYIEGKIQIERGERGNPPLALTTCHYHFNSPAECKAGERSQAEYGVRGIEAADFVCWAIKCKYEDGNNRWYSLIEKKVRQGQHIYFEGIK